MPEFEAWAIEAIKDMEADESGEVKQIIQM
jgi:hypothetical protein